MKALTVIPHQASSASLEDVDDPPPDAGEVLVATHAIGICGTDHEIIEGHYGESPPGESRLILGHESIGRVVEAPPASELRTGEWVVAMVRHPDPVPCPNCARGEWDMCRNGQYTEHGIKQVHGFGAERYRVAPDRLVRVAPAVGELGVLLEPTSVVAKAWEHIDRVATRSSVPVARVLITGAGPIGLLAALLAVQRGHDVEVLDRVDTGPKPVLVHALGARYITGDVADACRETDVIIECTGAAPVIYPAIANAPANAIVCLTGVSPRGAMLPIDVGSLNRDLVLENNVVIGSVNANRRHYEAAAAALAQADQTWLARLITRRAPLDHWQDALASHPDDVKTILQLSSS